MRYKGKSKGRYGNRSKRSVRSVQASRSKRARNQDARLRAPIAKNSEQWTNDPSHFDLPKVDLPITASRTITSQKKKVLVQPVVVETNSIEEEISEKPFTKAKNYADEHISSFEVLEKDYVERRHQLAKARLKGNIDFYQKVIKNIDNPDFLSKYGIYVGPRSKKKKIQEYEFSIKLYRKMLDRLDTPKGKAQKAHESKNKYIELVKKAIKHGETVPDEVVEQRPEFQVARDARRRYEKGLHTSFANKSAAVNAVMFHEKGYKVKRQDGKEITEKQIAEIDKGISEIQDAVGPIKDIMKKADLTVAHTSGKHPFLSGAGGVYHPQEKTITTGVLLIQSLAHEWTHWLDHEAGKQTRYGYEFYTNGRSSKRVKSFKEALSKAEEYSNPLFSRARQNMNNPWAIRKLLKAKREKKELPPDLQEMAKTMRARVGTYYRDPREIFARLVEEYVAVHHRKHTVASEKPEYYYKHPAYWNEKNFAELKPLVEAEIERRISIARGS